MGDPIEVGGAYEDVMTDELDLEVRCIKAVSRDREVLNESLGPDPRASGEYEEMERRYMEGEQMLVSTGLARREGMENVFLVMVMVMWEHPPVSRTSMSRKDPALPGPGYPLPLPFKLGRHEERTQVGGTARSTRRPRSRSRRNLLLNLYRGGGLLLNTQPPNPRPGLRSRRRPPS